MAVDPHELKDNRVNFRVSARQKALLEEAARSSSKPVSSFILDAASAEARRVLSERINFVLDEERWQRFNEALERPAMDKPRLRALLDPPSVFSD